MGAEDALVTDDIVPIKPIASSSGTPGLLSTYRPIRDQNFFDITDEELHELGLINSSAAKLLSLSGSDRLALVGTYCLTVLHGSVTLSGVTLTPSTTAHRVYAPRSSPIPVIQCLPPRGTIPPSPIALSGQMQERARSADALILLQDLVTGIEGLGRICRTFENVFELSRWQKARYLVDLGLSTLHYVRSMCLLWKYLLIHVRPAGRV